MLKCSLQSCATQPLPETVVILPTTSVVVLVDIISCDLEGSVRSILDSDNFDVFLYATYMQFPFFNFGRTLRLRWL